MFKECNCKYCSLYKRPWIWKLKSGWFWYEIPKNASSSIKKANGIRMGSKQTPDPSPNIVYFVYRDPYERFDSLFNHYFHETGRRFTRGKNFIQKMGHDISRISMNDRFNIFIDNIGLLASDEEVHHFYPQAWFLDPKQNNEKILIENLDMTDIRINTATSNFKFAHLAEDFIQDVYKEDFAL